jgi:hypothetical protein
MWRKLWQRFKVTSVSEVGRLAFAIPEKSFNGQRMSLLIDGYEHLFVRRLLKLLP